MKDLQKRVAQFVADNGMDTKPEFRALDLVSEVGEVAKEILKMTDYGRAAAKPREEIKSELGDVLFALTALADSLDVDLEEALEMVLGKYTKRLEKGSAGSESDQS
ncbi:nucleotide pyrophosphohydrolase [Candidatus Uhrbacteria bacterium]|nr:nucleotide pyrophosphohydrolase [Candidatus Uhrbacteria bacterium]